MTILASARVLFLILMTGFAGYAAVPAPAEVGVVLADPTTVGVSQFTHAGHSLVYLSGVCPEGPTHARLCRPGEQGSIVTTYPDFFESARYAWNIVPLSLYIEGFADPGTRLLYASAEVKRELQEHARTSFLSPVCKGNSCPEQPHAYWRDLVASTVDRDVFIYAVATTRAQDETLVASLNRLSNVNHYRTLTYNCSNFTADLINQLFPGSVHRDLLNDLAMMSPKSAARSFTHWALRQPQPDLVAMHFAQLPGSLPRAGLARSGTEDAIHMKKYLLPAALIGDHEVAGSFFVAYYLTGRFSLYGAYQAHPSAAVTAIDAEAKQAHRTGDEDEAIVLQADAQSVRDQLLGDRQAWNTYRTRFRALTSRPELHTLLPAAAPTYFPAWYAHAEVSVDSAGQPWLHPDEEGVREVGLSTANLLAPASDPRLAVQLMLARMAYALAAKNHYRETLPILAEDWHLLNQAVDRMAAQPELSIASNAALGSAPLHPLGR